MTLPKYDKSKRKKSYEVLPKGAYVVKIMDAKEDKWPSGDPCLRISYDIAEGEYKDFFQRWYDRLEGEDNNWPFDGVFTLNVPNDNSKPNVWNSWNSFFSDLEDSNNGFVFDGGNLKQLKGKLIGGKFNLEQREYKGQIRDHVHMKWTCVADDVRNGKAGQLPNDKYIMAPATVGGTEDFMIIPDGIEEENPFA